MIALTRTFVEQAYANVYLRAQDLPKHVRDGVHPIDADIDLPDYAGVLSKGWRWAFEHMASGQPRTFAEIDKQSPTLEFREYFTESAGDRRWWGDLLLKLGEHYVPLFPYFPGETFEERVANHEEEEFVSSLPRAIGLAHYGRIAGMAFVNNIPYSYLDYSRFWPHRADRALDLAAFFERERISGVASAARHLRRVATVTRKSDDELLRGFLVLLDTRNVGEAQQPRDLLLVEASARKPEIFLVNGLDFAAMEPLRNPVDWLDSYTSAILRRMQMKRS
jgi:hypothetical protein